MNTAKVVTPFPQRGIQCLQLRRIERGALAAFCDLRINAIHLVLHDCKWFRNGPQEWIGLPQTSYTNREGKTVYKDLVEFSDKEAAERFQAAALDAVHTYREN